MDKGILTSGTPFVPETGRDKDRSSVLDVAVSRFEHYKAPDNPISVNLLDWLTSAKYQKKVELIRSVTDKTERNSLKSKLPAITPSGLFSCRNEKGLVQHSGLLQFDIDLKENSHIANFYELKQQLSNIPNVAYCGLSVSGQGFWGLVPIAQPERHREHFDALKTQFLSYGIVLDTKPRNVSSLRGYSYDDEPHFNHQAEVFTALDVPVKSCVRPTGFELGTAKPNLRSETDRVERYITKIIDTGVDITSSYAAWFEIGCSLASAFGEAGRDYFHMVSQFHPSYTVLETDRQYYACLRGKYNYSIATFYRYYYDANITIVR